METSEFKVRIAKRQDIENFGINPYPVVTPSHVSLKNVLEVFSQESSLTYEDAEREETKNFAVCGRVVLFRPMGKNIFLQIQQGINRFQLMFSRGYTTWVGYKEKDEEGSLTSFKALEKKLDLGDFIHVQGYIFRTNKGEPTLRVKEVTLLSKSLLPLPDKHAGLEDKHTRYRKRWLDLISNEDVYQTFLSRSTILKTVRSFLDKRGFIEVETPVLQTIYGGAEAKPFTTHLHALDQDMFLRISLEPPLKKLIVGGLERVFEIGKVFRNEGIDRSHNPEFTLLELYQSYADYNEMMDLVESLFLNVAKSVLGTSILRLPHPHKEEEEIEIDFSQPWIRMTMEESLLHYAGIDVHLLSDSEMREKLLKGGHMEIAEIQTLSRGLLVGALFEVFVEPFLIQPHHILDHPQETTPFAQPHRKFQEKQRGLVERFESFILSREMCNAYSELNDPELQRSLLELQAKRRDSGDEEASPFDEEFVEAIEQGMPPTGGLGIGIDRLVMLFTKAASIRDVILFPMVRSHAEVKPS